MGFTKAHQNFGTHSSIIFGQKISKKLQKMAENVIFHISHDYFILKPSKSIVLPHLCKTACLFVRQSLHSSIIRESCKMVFPTFFCTNQYQEYETMPISTIFCNFLLIFGKKKMGVRAKFFGGFCETNTKLYKQC